MRLYHGSENIIEKPEYGKGKVHNDYGRGFYCTEHIDLACEWAVDEDRDGYANIYDFPLEELRVLNLNACANVTLSWMALLLSNRTFKITAPIEAEARRYLIENFMPDYEKADVIRGYRADDSYFAYAQDFLSNTISLEQLSGAMHFGMLGEQIVLKSKRAFDAISYIASEPVDSTVWYPKKEIRDSMARRAYSDIDKHTFNKGDTYMLMIMDRGITPDALRV